MLQRLKCFLVVLCAMGNALLSSFVCQSSPTEDAPPSVVKEPIRGCALETERGGGFSNSVPLKENQRLVDFAAYYFQKEADESYRFHAMRHRFIYESSEPGAVEEAVQRLRPGITLVAGAAENLAKQGKQLRATVHDLSGPASDWVVLPKGAKQDDFRKALHKALQTNQVDAAIRVLQKHEENSKLSVEQEQELTKLRKVRKSIERIADNLDG